MMINLKETEEQKVYVSSDLHLGHNRDFVFESRGFVDVNTHNNGVIDSINLVARPKDILILLGDFCLNTSHQQFDAYLDRINCQNIFSLWGNHNNPHEKSVYKKGMIGDTETYPYRYKNMVYYPHYVEAVINGQFIVMLHYPLYVWNEQSHGAWMLCGHSHCGCDFSHEANPDGKILDVGWDGHKKPWSFAEIQTVMNQKQFVVMDNHHK